MRVTDYLAASNEELRENKLARLKSMAEQAKKIKALDPAYGVLLTEMVANAIAAMKATYSRPDDFLFCEAMEIEVMSVLYATGGAVCDLQAAWAEAENLLLGQPKGADRPIDIPGQLRIDGEGRLIL